MIKLKHLLMEIDDEKIIKYKDKDGKPGEMKAGSAKTMEKGHPAKIAWDKMQDSDGGKDGKSAAGKVSFDRTAGDDTASKSDGNKSYPDMAAPYRWADKLPVSQGKTSKGSVKDGKATIAVNPNGKHGHGKDIVADIDNLHKALYMDHGLKISKEELNKQVENGDVTFNTKDFDSEKYSGSYIDIKLKDPDNRESDDEGFINVTLTPKEASNRDVYPDNPQDGWYEREKAAKKAKPKAGGDPSQKRSKSNPSGWYDSNVPGENGRVSKGIVKDGKVTISVDAKKKHGHGKDIVADIDKMYDAINNTGRKKAISREDFVKQIEDGTVEFTSNDLNSKEFPGTGIIMKFKSAEEWNSKADGTAVAEMDPKIAAKFDVYPDNPRAEPKDPKPKGQKVVDGKFTVGDGDKKEEVDVEAIANTLDLPGIDAKTLAKKFESGDAKMEADENGRISFSFNDDKLGSVNAEIEDDGHYDFDASDLAIDEDDKEYLEDSLRDTLDYYHDQFKPEDDDDDDEDMDEGMIKLKSLLKK